MEKRLNDVHGELIRSQRAQCAAERADGRAQR
jgi:hypothetical protein